MNSETNFYEDNRQGRPVRRGNPRRRSKKRRRHNNFLGILLGIIGVSIVILSVILLLRYTPTRETMDLADFFALTSEESAAVIFDGEYDENTDPMGIVRDGVAYLNLSYAKEHLDDAYVYDSTESTLRYVNGMELITAYMDSQNYLVDREQRTFDSAILTSDGSAVYISLDWMKNYTDFTYYFVEEPNRIVIEEAGWEHTVATVKRRGAYRRFGGIKSKILDEASKGDSVIVLEDYGKWSYVLNERGVLGCIENKKLKSSETVTTEATLPEREYTHMTFAGKVNLGWHQVTNATANANLETVLANTSGLNVISPTWWGLSDNYGSISDLSDGDYVATCHANGIQVWGLVSNFVNSDIDTTTVLNTTSSRDALVNNLIAAAITTNVDGINVDFESLSIDAKDGYIEFIRELSIKCKNNNLYLSVDNYKPTSYTEFYNREEQAKYADYVILMGYDEHYSGSEESGSVASLPFVQEGIADTLAEVPAEQLILGMPFYTRIWTTDVAGNLSSEARGMQSAQEFVERNEVELVWDDALSQYYGEFYANDLYYQIWMEDTQSLAAKLNLMNSENLAGGAFWKLGFEPYSVWDTISSYMN